MDIKLPDDMKILGLAGFAGSGKDYIAKEFFQKMGFFKVSLANGFKHKVVGSGKDYGEVFTDGEKDPETRDLLQQEGTERGRDIYGKDIWVRTLESYMLWNYHHNNIKNFVISDVRFHNEVAWLKSVGTAIFVESDRAYELEGNMANHPSEAELRDMGASTWDFILINDKEIGKDHLHQQIDYLVQGVFA